MDNNLEAVNDPLALHGLMMTFTHVTSGGFCSIKYRTDDANVKLYVYATKIVEKGYLGSKNPIDVLYIYCCLLLQASRKIKEKIEKDDIQKQRFRSKLTQRCFWSTFLKPTIGGIAFFDIFKLKMKGMVNLFYLSFVQLQTNCIPFRA